MKPNGWKKVDAAKLTDLPTQLDCYKGWIDKILAAEKEANKASIRANAILINESLAKTKLFAMGVSAVTPRSLTIMSPMILGLRAAMTDDLPDEFAFALVRSKELESEEDKLKQLRRRAEIAELALMDAMRRKITAADSEALIDDITKEGIAKALCERVLQRAEESLDGGAKPGQNWGTEEEV